MPRDLVEQLGATVSGDPDDGRQSPLITMGAVALIAGIAYATDPFRKGVRWPWKKGSTNDSLVKPNGSGSRSPADWRQDWSLEPPAGPQGDAQVNRRFVVAKAKDKAYDALRRIGVLFQIPDDAQVQRDHDELDDPHGALDVDFVWGWLMVPRRALHGKHTLEAMYDYEHELDRLGAWFVTLHPETAVRQDDQRRGLWVRACFAVHPED